jgi:hypothetical protein
MAINLDFRKLITWPMGDKMQVVMFDLKNWYGMASVMCVIDGTHISIAKPFGVYYENCFFDKIGGTMWLHKWWLTTKKGSWMFMWDCLGV